MRTLVALLVMSLASPFWLTAVSGGEENKTAPDSKELEVGPFLLVRDFKDNEIGANEKYQGKLLRVTAMVGKVSMTHVFLAADRFGFDWVKCQIGIGDKDVVKNYRKGQKITVSGICLGQRAGTVYLTACRFSKAPVQDDLFKADGQLTNDDPKDRVRTSSVHKVHTVKMTAGKTYTIDLVSGDFDAYLRLEDSMGKQLAADDDSGGELNARILFQAPRDDTYRIIATTFLGGTGHYTLTVRGPG